MYTLLFSLPGMKKSEEKKYMECWKINISRSEVFELAMSSNFREREEKKIELKSFAPRSVQEFVRFLYGFELDPQELEKNLAMVKELTEMAGVYNVPGLETAVVPTLLKGITKETMVEMMDFVTTKAGPEVTEAVSEYIALNFDVDTLKSSGIFLKHPELAVKILTVEKPSKKEEKSKMTFKVNGFDSKRLINDQIQRMCKTFELIFLYIYFNIFYRRRW